MIEYVLDQHRHQQNPLVLRGTLPVSQYSDLGTPIPAISELVLRLYLKDELPFLRLEAGQTRLVAEVPPQWLAEWQTMTEQLTVPLYPGRFPTLHAHPPMGMPDRAFQTFHIYVDTFSSQVQIDSEQTGVRLTLNPGDQAAWHQDLGLVLDLAHQIREFVIQYRGARRDDLLQQIDNLITSAFL